MSLLAQLHILLLTPEINPHRVTSRFQHWEEGSNVCRKNDGCRSSPNFEDLPRLFFSIRGGGDDEQPIQQVDGDAMRALIVCAADTERKTKKSKYSVLNIIFLIILK